MTVVVSVQDGIWDALHRLAERVFSKFNEGVCTQCFEAAVQPRSATHLLTNWRLDYFGGNIPTVPQVSYSGRTAGSLLISLWELGRKLSLQAKPCLHSLRCGLPTYNIDRYGS